MKSRLFAAALVACGLVARIQPPVFPDRDFPITRFGAVEGGRVDATDAFRAAIEACHRAGGGRVVVPPANAMRGGTIENVFVRDVEIGEVGSAIDIDMLYEKGPPAPSCRWCATCGSTA